MLDVVTNSSNHSWILFVVIFLGAVAFLAIIRRVETQRIFKKFNREDLVLLTFGTNYFGRESEAGGLARSSGALVLTKNELYYRARYAKYELSIPGKSLVKIDITDSFKGKPLHQSAVAIYFIDEDGDRDRAVFRIPHTPQWFNLINSMFISRNTQ